MSITTSVPRGISTSRGAACGSAPCAPAATIGGNDGPSAPRSSMKRDDRARHLALGAAREAALAQRLVGVVGDLGGRRIAAQLALVLDRAQPLDEARRRAPARPRRPPSRSASRWARTLMCASSKPARPRSRCARSPSRSRPPPAARSPAPAAGLLDVAEVGQEQALVARDHAGAVGAREAGQVAHVHEVRSRAGSRARARRAAPTRRSARGSPVEPLRAAARAPRGSPRGPCPAPSRCRGRGSPRRAATPRARRRPTGGPRRPAARSPRARRGSPTSSASRRPG